MCEGSQQTTPKRYIIQPDDQNARALFMVCSQGQYIHPVRKYHVCGWCTFRSVCVCVYVSNCISMIYLQFAYRIMSDIIHDTHRACSIIICDDRLASTILFFALVSCSRRQLLSNSDTIFYYYVKKPTSMNMMKHEDIESVQ